ncbi:MarR family winged helix-turn-helix transcriptional regulator [Aquirufa sp. ROCK2-A2]
MGINDDIKQQNFTSEEQKALLNVIFTGNWVAHQQHELLKPFGLTMQQYNVLRILRGQNGQPMTVLAIIERMLDKTSNASRLVDKLLEKKLVIRRECPNDRRAVDILILPEGLSLLSEIDLIQQEWNIRFSKVGKENLQKLNELLDLFRS